MATSTFAPASATRGPSYGHGYATTTDTMLLATVGDREALTQSASSRRSQLSCAAVPPSAMSLPGLIRHLADIERWWFRQQFAVLSGHDGPSSYQGEAVGPP